MMRINLLPERARASYRVIQVGTILFVAAIVLMSVLSFWTVYLRWQLASEKDRLNSYQATMASLQRFQGETSRLQREAAQVENLSKPLADQLVANQLPVDLTVLLERIAISAPEGPVWLRELSVQKDGSLPITGYAVEHAEVTRFLGAMGRAPLNVTMGSTRWVDRGSIQLLEFTARVSPATGGERP